MTTNEHQCDHFQLIDGALVRCNRKATVEVESYDGDEDDVSIELFCDEHSFAHQAELWKEQARKRAEREELKRRAQVEARKAYEKRVLNRSLGLI